MAIAPDFCPGGEASFLWRRPVEISPRRSRLEPTSRAESLGEARTGSGIIFPLVISGESHRAPSTLASSDSTIFLIFANGFSSTKNGQKLIFSAEAMMIRKAAAIRDF